MFHGKSGRPRCVDEIGMNNLIETIHNLNNEQRSPTKREIGSLVNIEAINTKRRRGIANEVVPLAHKTVKNVRDALLLGEGKG